MSHMAAWYMAASGARDEAAAGSAITRETLRRWIDDADNAPPVEDMPDLSHLWETTTASPDSRVVRRVAHKRYAHKPPARYVGNQHAHAHNRGPGTKARYGF